MKARRTLWFVFSAAIALSLLIGTTGTVSAGPPKPGEGPLFKVASGAYPPTLIWQDTSALITRIVGANIYEALVTFNRKYEVVPMLATKWEMAPDGLSYTFHLRQGVKFHNGKEMTSEDVVHSIKRFKTHGARGKDLAMVKDVVAVDKYTVRFDLERKTGTLLASLGSPLSHASIMPKEAVMQSDGTYFPTMKIPIDEKHVIGTGPYKYNKWLRDRYLSLTYHKDYTPHTDVPGESGLGGNRVGYYKEIRFYKVNEPDARIAGVETGQYHLADEVSYELAMQVKDKPGVAISKISPAHYGVIFFNHQPDPDGTPSLFSNLKMRQAVQALIDMEEIMKAAGSGPGRLDPGIMWREHVFWTDVGKELYNQANPEKAKQLLKEAGYDGREIRLMTNQQYPYMYKAAVYLQAQLKSIDVPAKLLIVDWPTQLKMRLKGGSWDISFTGNTTRFDPSQHNFSLRGASSYGGYDKPEMNALLEAGENEVEFEKRYEIYKKVQKLMYDDVVWMRTFDDNNYQVHTAKLKDYSPWYVLRLWNTWLED